MTCTLPMELPLYRDGKSLRLLNLFRILFACDELGAVLNSARVCARIMNPASASYLMLSGTIL